MSDVSYAGVTATALWAAIAECGASPMEIDPAVVAALLREAEEGRELRDAVELAGNHSLFDCESEYLATDGDTAATGATPAAALIALANKKGWHDGR